MKTKKLSPKKGSLCNAFSLTEMLMTLLIVSLLLTAMAPVMTKKTKDMLSVSGRKNYAVLAYGDANCPTTSLVTASDGSQYCQGNFLVPDGATELTVTLIGAGGGGGAAFAKGYVEYTSSSAFTVPQGGNQLDVILVGGGSGGAGGEIRINTREYTTPGNGVLDISGATGLKGSPMLVTMTGAGGGGGSGGFWSGGGGGSGAYYNRQRLVLPSTYSSNTIALSVGAGGAGGTSYGSGGGGGASTFGNSPWGLSAGGGGGGCGEHGTGGAGANPSFATTGLTMGSGGAGGGVIVPNIGLVVRGGGNGASPNGATGGCPNTEGGNIPCGNGRNGTMTTDSIATVVSGLPAGVGGNSPYGAGAGPWSVNTNCPNIVSTRYGAGGCGTSSNIAGLAPTASSGAGGYLKVEYPTFIRYGGGGGGGQVVPPTRLAPQNAGAVLNVTIGAGGLGGSAPILNNDGTLTAGANGGDGGDTRIIRNNDSVQLLTARGVSGGMTNGVWGGPPRGIAGESGTGTGTGVRGTDNTCWISRYGARDDGVGNNPNYDNGVVSGNTWLNCALIGKGGGLGDGFNRAANGTGYGAGGGSGYGWGGGGSGVSGYAKLNYNPASLGYGGGGASGNKAEKIVVSSVRSGIIIPYTIGAGGVGGTILNNVVTHGRKGGDTTFGNGAIFASVGGGNGGTSPTTSGSNITNGTGGGVNNTCVIDNTISTKCKGATSGFNPSGTNGGAGAASYEGPGGGGGTLSTAKTQSDGRATIAVGAGGGGAAVLEYNNANTPLPTFPEGGRGGHGMIIVEWK